MRHSADFDRYAAHECVTEADGTARQRALNRATISRSKCSLTGEYDRFVRSDYYGLDPARRSLVRSNAYPVPHPEYTSVGIHFTRRTDDKVIVGPNVALAFAREGYEKMDVNVCNLLGTLWYGDFWRLLGSRRRSTSAITLRTECK